jgi:hypothetical protein
VGCLSRPETIYRPGDNVSEGCWNLSSAGVFISPKHRLCKGRERGVERSEAHAALPGVIVALRPGQRVLQPRRRRSLLADAARGAPGDTAARGVEGR